jgi:hypothetical protein
MKMLKHLGAIALSVAILMGCSSQKKDDFIVQFSIHAEKMDMEQLTEALKTAKAHGATRVVVWSSHGYLHPHEARDIEFNREAAERAHSMGLKVGIGINCCMRKGMPQDWYAVNRLGQPSDEFPAYKERYKFLDPHKPEVHQYLKETIAAFTLIPDVDYIALDLVRYPDVIMAAGLRPRYGVFSAEEYPPADYCYCDLCVNTFKEQTGIDIRAVEDPSTCAEWAQFRCDVVTDLVNDLAQVVHSRGKELAAFVFPGPGKAIQVVRQDWPKWNIDAYMPMNFNCLYETDMQWLKDVTVEEVEASHGIPLVSAFYLSKDWQNRDNETDCLKRGLTPSELEQAIADAKEAGVQGIGLPYALMSPEHFEVMDKFFVK